MGAFARAGTGSFGVTSPVSMSMCSPGAAWGSVALMSSMVIGFGSSSKPNDPGDISDRSMVS